MIGHKKLAGLLQMIRRSSSVFRVALSTKDRKQASWSDGRHGKRTKWHCPLPQQHSSNPLWERRVVRTAICLGQL